MPKTCSIKRLSDEQRKIAEELISSHISLIYKCYKDWLYLSQSEKNRYQNEILSELMRTALRAAISFDPALGNKFSTYLCTYLMRSLGDIVRKIQKYKRLVPSEPDGAIWRQLFISNDETVTQNENIELARKILARLNEEDRKLVDQRIFQDMTYDEIAAVSDGVTKQRIQQRWVNVINKMKYLAKTYK